MLPLVAVLNVLLPMDVYQRMSQFIQIFDFEGKVSSTELCVLLQQTTEAFAQLCDVPVDLDPATGVEEIRSALFGEYDTDALLGVDELAHALLQPLQSFARVLAGKSAAFQSLACGPCRDETLPELQKGALFLGRYRVLERRRSVKPEYFQKVTLIVDDELE